MRNRHTQTQPSLTLSLLLFATLWGSLFLLQLSTQAYEIQVQVVAPAIEEMIPEPIPEEVAPVAETPNDTTVQIVTPTTPIIPTTPTPSDQPVTTPPTPTDIPADITPGPFALLSALLQDLRANELVMQISQNILRPTAGANAVIVSTIASLTVVNSTKDVVPMANHFFNSAINLLAFRRRKKRTWSYIYDSSTKLPVDLSVVRLIEAKTKSIIATAVSDAQGRFALEVNPGSYTIEVSKPLYLFPSRLVAGLTRDGKHENLYFGAVVTKDSRGVLDLSLPIDPISARQTTISPLDRIRSLFDRISTPALVLGLIIAGFVSLLQPNALNIAILCIYILLFIFKKIISKKTIKPWGKVIDVATGRPIPGIVVRAFDAKYNKLIDTKVTDETGSFNFLFPPGKYYIKVLSYQYRIPRKKHEESYGYGGEIFEVVTGSIEPKRLYLEKYAAKITYDLTTQPAATSGNLHAETIFDYFSAKNQDAAQVLKKLAQS